MHDRKRDAASEQRVHRSRVYLSDRFAGYPDARVCPDKDSRLPRLQASRVPLTYPCLFGTSGPQCRPEDGSVELGLTCRPFFRIREASLTRVLLLSSSLRVVWCAASAGSLYRCPGYPAPFC